MWDYRRYGYDGVARFDFRDGLFRGLPPLFAEKSAQDCELAG